MKVSKDQIRLAKEVLSRAGYYTDNLWNIKDVQSEFKCSDEEAMEILEESLNNLSQKENINLSIRFSAEDRKLKKN